MFYLLITIAAIALGIIVYTENKRKVCKLKKICNLMEKNRRQKCHK